MSKRMPEMPAQMVNIHKATLENIGFAKKQQWQITNYTALIYVGLFGLTKVSALQSQQSRKLELSGSRQ